MKRLIWISLCMLVGMVVLLSIWKHQKTLDSEIKFAKTAVVIKQQKNGQEDIATKYAGIERGKEGLPDKVKVLIDQNTGNIDCGNDLQAKTGNIERKSSEYFQSLAKSYTKDEQLLYALFSEFADNNARLDRLFAFQENFPAQDTSAIEIVRLCSVVKNHRKCDADAITKLIQKAPKNAELIRHSIHYFAKYGNDNDLMQAVRALTQTSYSYDKFAQSIALYIAALAQQEIGDFCINTLSVMDLRTIIKPRSKYWLTKILCVA
jgi:hypothetical protein